MIYSHCVCEEKRVTCDLEKYQLLSDKTYYTCLGRVSKVVGLTIESIGPEAKLNDLCKIYRDREQIGRAHV